MKNFDLKRLNILVVEDNKHMRRMVLQILRALGVFNTMEAENGEAALMTLGSFPADMVICDWNMAPMDGLAFTRAIRDQNSSPYPFLPIIMLTGHTELHKVLEARDAGINEFLSKPISVKKLYSRISTVIEHPRPFIHCETYFGPDRRRVSGKHDGSERRKSNLETEEGT